MTRHGKDKPLFNTRLGILIILGIAVILGVGIFWFFLRPLDASSTLWHVAQHVKPNTGRIIAKAPQVKHRIQHSVSLHAWHIRHVLHLHALHVKHVLHESHLAYLNHVYG